MCKIVVILFISLLNFTCKISKQDSIPVANHPKPPPKPLSNNKYLDKAHVFTTCDLLKEVFSGSANDKISINIQPENVSWWNIKYADDVINITGNVQQGVLYFLDVYCGVRYYMPTFKTGARDSIFIPLNLNIVHTPSAHVFSTGYEGSDAYIWSLFHSNVYDLRYQGNQHTMAGMFRDSEIYKAYPSIYYYKSFPENDNDQNWEPDFDSPELVNAALYAARKYFLKNDVEYISFSVMDSYNGYNESKTNREITDANARFLNELADSFKIEFPGKFITYLLYSKVTNLPSFKLRDNIIPITVYQLANALDDKRFDQVDAFAAISKNIGNHDWAQGKGYLYPRIYNHLTQKFIQAYESKGVKFKYAQLEYYPNWSLDGPKYYIMGKIYDNPYANIDSMMNLFCNDMFGLDSDLMFKYFSTLENLSEKMENDYPFSIRKMYNYASQTKLNDEEYNLLEEAKTYIDEAMAASSGTSNERVNFFNTGFKVFYGIFKYKNKGMNDGEITDYIEFLKDPVIEQQIIPNASILPPAPLPPTTITLSKNSEGGIYFKNNGTVKAGDTLLIPAGFYNYMSFDGLQGLPGKEIVIRNTGGQVVTGQTNYCYRFVNSKYFKFSGTGDANFKYGFKANLPGGRAGSGMNCKENTSDYEIEFYEAHKVANGFLCKIDPYDCLPESWFPNFTIQNISFHDCYVHDTDGEGFYIINTAETQQVKDCAGNTITVETVQGRNIKIYNNIVDSTGWDGIQVAATTNLLIHDNSVTHYGMENKGTQQAGIIFGAKSNGSIYNNFIGPGTGEGLEFYGFGGPSYIYNNVIFNAGHDGTTAGQDAIAIDDRPQPNNKYIGQLVYVSNNTIITPARNCIHLYNSYGTQTTNEVHGNLLIGPGNPSPYDEPFINMDKPIRADTTGNIRFKFVSQVGFFDTLANDFRLKQNIVGLNTLKFGVINDFNDKPRTSYTAGAFEADTTIVIPPPPPPVVSSSGYHFSSSIGDDSRTPLEARNELTPWKTLDKLNQIFPLITPVDTVFLRSGDIFPCTSPITPTRNGTPTNPIVFTTYGTGLQPIINPLQNVTGWIDRGLGIFESAPIKAGLTLNVVKVDGKLQAMGRYPNSGYLTFEGHGADYIIDNQLTSLVNWTGAEAVIRPKRWVLDRVKIRNHVNGYLFLSTPLTYPPYDNYGYFIQNSKKTLDSLGEWYYNPATKTISMFFGPVNPNTVDVQASGVDTLVNLTRVSNLEFDSMAFIGANDAAFGINYCQGITIKNCSILFSGLAGVRASSTDNLVIDHNYIDLSANNGINLSYNCNRARITQNIISNTGTLAGMGLGGNGNYQGITVTGSNNFVAYNSITNTGSVPIRFQGGDSNVIANNFIDTYTFVKDDAGGIYTVSSASNPKYYGNRITGNIVINGIGAPDGTDRPGTGSSSGIYLDDYTTNVEISNNTVSNNFLAGILFHNAIGTKVIGNTLYNNNTQLLAWHDTAGNASTYLRNNIIKNNNLVAKKTQLIFKVITTADDLSLLGVMDSNYYSRPEEMKLPFAYSYILNNVRSESLTDLPGWQNKFGLDKNSRQGLPVMPVTDSITGPNLISNGTFNTNTIGAYSTPVGKWVTGALDGGSFQGTTTVGFWQVIIKMGTMTAGKKYRLQFSSLASKDTIFNAYARLNTSPYTKITDVPLIAFKKTRTENKYILTAKATSSNSSLVFDTKARGLTFWMDNVGLYETNFFQPDPLTYYLFNYNFDRVPKLLQITGNYIDAFGNVFTATSWPTVAPYSSIVLTKN